MRCHTILLTEQPVPHFKGVILKAGYGHGVAEAEAPDHGSKGWMVESVNI